MPDMPWSRKAFGIVHVFAIAQKVVYWTHALRAWVALTPHIGHAMKKKFF